MNAVLVNTPLLSPNFPLATDVSRAAEGDAGAFERLIDATKRVVTSITFAIVRDIAASEDVAQDVYVVAWRDLPTLKNVESFLPWLRQLARNKALESLRSKRRYERRHAPWERAAATVPTATASVLEHAISKEEKVVLAEALEALPDDAREVLTLFYREGSSVKQVATLLDLSEVAVKKRLERARGTLQAEVLARFEVLVRKTAPGAPFTAVVLAAITIAAPSTAAAATAAGAGVAKTASAAVAASFGGAIVGLAGGVLGVFLGMRRYVNTAIDADERRALTHFRDRTAAVTAAFAVGCSLVSSPLVASASFLGKTGSILSILVFLAMMAAFVAYLFGAYHYRLPAILKRREELERLRDPQGFAARKKRDRALRVVGYLVGGAGAAVGIGVAIRALLATH